MKSLMDQSNRQTQKMDVRFGEPSESGGQIEIEFLKPLPLNRPCPSRRTNWLNRLLDRIRPAGEECDTARPDQLNLDLE